jgi:hypothetical protein
MISQRGGCFGLPLFGIVLIYGASFLLIWAG